MTIRIVELDGRVDRRDPASAASPDDSPYGLPSGPVLLSPSTVVERRGLSSRWREARTARRARNLVHIDELRSLASSDAEALRAARNAGAKAATAELGELLGPGYTLFLAYRNPRGVIDQLLLCPQGLVAMTS